MKNIIKQSTSNLDTDLIFFYLKSIISFSCVLLLYILTKSNFVVLPLLVITLVSIIILSIKKRIVYLIEISPENRVIVFHYTSPYIFRLKFSHKINFDDLILFERLLDATRLSESQTQFNIGEKNGYTYSFYDGKFGLSKQDIEEIYFALVVEVSKK
jgi:hypothetical protein